eukprot:CAMPEP_0184480370 /NCGR_PEP_ID=MMETSP0113_2-20130426/1872_1 /TAXON_ID=91329 /ORGANISM="Norrisiella sphaerica, Strain BC52" /LENGTH=1235 /DNA_ID=CAMNT_0026858805 /DNA_START=178 /DNA_END=3882 /DNA_ORIENTATION=-
MTFVATLTEYMVPHTVRIIDRLPLTANGKMDRGALARLFQAETTNVIDATTANSNSSVFISTKPTATMCSVGPENTIPPSAMEVRGEQVDPDAEDGFKLSVMIRVWCHVLEVESAILEPDSNFFVLGGDSISCLRLVSKANTEGLKLSVNQIFSNPTLRQMADAASVNSSHGRAQIGDLESDSKLDRMEDPDAKKVSVAVGVEEHVEKEDEVSGKAMQLVGIQEGYWIGMQLPRAQGGMSPVLYVEYEIDNLDVARLQKAVAMLAKRHAVLRARINVKTGKMEVQPPNTLPDSLDIDVTDYYKDDRSIGSPDSKTSISLSESRVDELRCRLINQGVDPRVWPPFKVHLSRTHSTKWRAHFVVSLIVVDGRTEMILRKDLMNLYCLASMPCNNETTLALSEYASDAAFFKQMKALSNVKKTDEYGRARQYWMQRLRELPGPPDITTSPLTSASHSLEEVQLQPAFGHVTRKINPEIWNRFKEKCRMGGMTTSNALLAVYAHVLARQINASKRNHFLLNVLHTMRRGEGAFEVAGNFSSTTLLEVKYNANNNFTHFAEAISKQLANDMEHWQFSGVQVSREINKLHGDTFKAVAPYVFTSTLGLASHDSATGTSEVSYNVPGATQIHTCVVTPHVMLDHQVVEEDNHLVLYFDFLLEGFTPGRIERIGDIYEEVIFNLATKAQAWSTCLKALQKRASAVSSYRSACGVDKSMLQDQFLRIVQGMRQIGSTVKPDTNNHDAKHENAPTSIPTNGTLTTIPSSPANTADFTGVSSVSDKGYRTSVTYQTLEIMSRVISNDLLSILPSQCRKDAPVVAVSMNKGWRQIAGVLGCLRAGCAYLPLDPFLPYERRQRILAASGAQVVLTETQVLSQARRHISCAAASSLGSLDDTAGGQAGAGEGVENECAPYLIFNIDSYVSIHGPLDQTRNHKTEPMPSTHDTPIALHSPSQQLAYLIYTSGSTGVPKGVRCHHMGAMNTILDLNSRFHVTEKDAVLALSSLSFDLSVYDIFGMLSAGGRVVLPESQVPDPVHWLQLMEAEKVTIWNTVPRLMELMVTHCEHTGNQLPPSLRLVYLSGDFIPLSLPSRIRKLSRNPELEIVSMGGATEAAIWSNIHVIPRDNELESGWSSIPYGRPMRNQSMYILDDDLEHCEPWVTGRVFIGGVGVAHGYHGDRKRTAEHFIEHPISGEHLFRPGDLGRVRECGKLEILGREDDQVKLNGFRIELGEIERVAETHDEVS